MVENFIEKLIDLGVEPTDTHGLASEYETAPKKYQVAMDWGLKTFNHPPLSTNGLINFTREKQLTPFQAVKAIAQMREKRNIQSNQL